MGKRKVSILEPAAKAVAEIKGRFDFEIDASQIKFR